MTFKAYNEVQLFEWDTSSKSFSSWTNIYTFFIFYPSGNLLFKSEKFKTVITKI